MADIDNDDDMGPIDGRGPGYPVISLEKAIARLEEVRAAGLIRANLPMVGFLKIWGYKSASGPARRQIAALKHYGLLDYNGTGKERKVRLSDLALNILLDKVPESSARAAALKQAALTPSVFRRLIETFPYGIATDAGIEKYLTLTEKYGEDAAQIVIRVFKETVSYAALDKPSQEATDEYQLPKYTNNPFKNNVMDKNYTEDKKSNMESNINLNGRIVFTEEESPQQHIRLVATGELNEYLLDALSDFIKRQRKRLGINSN